MVITKSTMIRGKLVLEKTNDQGKTYKSGRIFSELREDSTDEAVYNTLNAIGALQKNPVQHILRITEKELIDNA